MNFFFFRKPFFPFQTIHIPFYGLSPFSVSILIKEFFAFLPLCPFLDVLSSHNIGGGGGTMTSHL